jgi:hypothetical protein
VRVEIGPVNGDSAVAWIAYGRRVLHHVRGIDHPSVPDDALARFEELLDRWEAIARPGESFSWASEDTAEDVEFLMKALYEIGLVVEAEHAAGRSELRPAAADEFHVLVVRQVLAQVEAESPTASHFVQGLRQSWGVAGQE